MYLFGILLAKTARIHLSLLATLRPSFLLVYAPAPCLLRRWKSTLGRAEKSHEVPAVPRRFRASASDPTGCGTAANPTTPPGRGIRWSRHFFSLIYLILF